MNDEWVSNRVQAVLWRGHRKDEFPSAETLAALSRDGILRHDPAGLSPDLNNLLPFCWNSFLLSINTNRAAFYNCLFQCRMLRQAGAEANTACCDEDLRKQLSDSSHLWEAERVLACQTPDEV